MKIRGFILIVVFLFFFLKQVVAQSDTTRQTTKQLLGYFGMHSPNLTNLNTVFRAYNYPEFNPNCFSAGFGLMKVKKKFVGGVNFYTYNQSQSKDTVTSSIRTLGMGQSYGYSYLMKQKFQMYTFIGWSTVWTTVKVSKNIPSNTQFNFYTSSIGNQIEMKTENFMVDVSTHINYLIKTSKDLSNKERIIIGIRGGYLLPLKKSQWTMNKAKLLNSPNINAGGYYVSIVLGFAG